MLQEKKKKDTFVAENTENPCLADFGGTWVLVCV